MSFPVASPVLVVALAMGIFLVAPLLVQRARVPGMIGIILAGAVVGPNGLNLLARDQTIVLLGTVGLLYLMFLAAIEIDLHGFRRYRNQSLGFGALTFLPPQALGIGVGLMLGYGMASSILLASMFASHTLVSYPIALRLGIGKNRAVTAAVGGTIVTDTAALLVLAVVSAWTRGALDADFWTRLAVLLGLYVVAIVILLPRLARWFFRNTRTGGLGEYVFILTALFGGAYLAEVAGMEGILGAFLVGLSLNRLIPEQSLLNNRIHFVGEAIFIPFFLLSVGMLVDVRVLAADVRVWQVMLAMTVTVVVTKWLAAMIAGRFFHYSEAESWIVFGLSVPQAAATLAATLVGLEVGLFDEAVLNGSILMILATCIVGPLVLDRKGRQVALQEEQTHPKVLEAPQRILVPMSNPATAKDLLDLALMLRSAGSTEPIYLLTVVPADADRAAEYVANAEKMLSHSVTYAAGADVPVVPVTRVDHNFASGIARGIAETRTSTLIVGWDGKQSARTRIFGSVLDQLLEETRQQVLVAKLGHPLNTTGRLIVVVPRGADYLPGFVDAVRVLKLMANRLGAVIVGYSVEAPGETYRDHFDSVRPEAPTTFAGVDTWREVIDLLHGDLKPDDLVIVLSSRRGAISWTPVLEQLPGRLARLVPESVIMLYPAEVKPRVMMGAPVAALPRALSPRRIRVGLEGLTFEAAMRALLECEFGGDSARVPAIVAELVANAGAFATEVKPGVVVQHARIEGLSRGLVFLGTSAGGIRVRGVAEPARLLFVVLSTAGEPEQHLNHLAEIAWLVGDPERETRLLAAAHVDEILAIEIGEAMDALGAFEVE